MRQTVATALICAAQLAGIMSPLSAAEEHPAKAFSERGPVDAPVWRFNESRALETIRAHGFYGVRNLKQTLAGVWQGQAIRYGNVTAVEVDQTGNFSEYAQ